MLTVVNDFKACRFFRTVFNGGLFHRRFPNVMVLTLIGILSASTMNGIALAQKTADPTTKSSKNADAEETKKTVLPKLGLAKANNQTVALDTNNFPLAMREIVCGTLGRELIRQSFLIAARDEMGLTTLDTSLGEVTYTADAPQAYALQLNVEFEPVPKGAQTAKLKVRLIRPSPSEPAFKWYSEPTEVEVYRGPWTLAEQMETKSRGEFIEALKQAGYSKDSKENAPKNPPIAESNFDGQMDFVSQFSQLRLLHAERQSQDETVEYLGALVRAYANLGNLIDFHWSPGSKTFKARSVIYAQRMVSKYGQSPFTLAHRAYAWALTGNHVYALENVKAAREAQGQAAPDWMNLIEAFSTHEPTGLSVTGGANEQLAFYLRMRLADPFYERSILVDASGQLMEKNPACCRTVEAFCETGNVGLSRAATEGGADQVWSAIYKRMVDVPQFPSSAAKIRERLADKTLKMGTPDEREMRTKLAAALRATDRNEPDRVEPAFKALAELIDDVTFVQCWRLIHCETNVLGLDASETIEALWPYMKNHRMAPCLKVYSDRRQVVSAAVAELMELKDLTHLEMPCIPFATSIRKKQPDLVKRFDERLLKQWDLIEDDLMRSRFSYAAELRKQIFAWIYEVSPHHPRAIARSIEKNFNAQRGAKWEKKYPENAFIQLTIGQQYQKKYLYDDAERCLRKSIELTPSFEACRVLGNQYYAFDEFEESQKIFEKALELESFGLEQSNVHRSLAYSFMRKGKWREAKPYAIAAANTYSGNGLRTGARCAEGLKDWPVAESYVRALSERYDGSGDNWYIWCARTNRGNIKAAKALADQAYQRVATPLDYSGMMQLVMGKLISKDFAGAKRILVDPSNQKIQKAHSLMLAALLADGLGQADERDALLHNIESNNDGTQAIPTLSHLFRTAIRQPDEFHWNRHSFDELIDWAPSDNVVALYYFAGTFLQVHKQKELGREYLECAATAEDVYKNGCALANLALRTQKAKIGPTRIHNRPDSWFPAVGQLNKGLRFRRSKKYDVARKLFDEAIEGRPDYVWAYVCRGQLNETEGMYAAAVEDFEHALRINPDSEQALTELAELQATCEKDEFRNTEQALKHAQHAFDLRQTPTYSNFVTLAMAYAERGDFPKAIELQKKAIELAPKKTTLPKVLSMYEQGQSYRLRGPKEEPNADDANAGEPKMDESGTEDSKPEESSKKADEKKSNLNEPKKDDSQE